jgi:hypothetical protein
MPSVASMPEPTADRATHGDAAYASTQFCTSSARPAFGDERVSDQRLDACFHGRMLHRLNARFATPAPPRTQPRRLCCRPQGGAPVGADAAADSRRRPGAPGVRRLALSGCSDRGGRFRIRVRGARALAVAANTDAGVSPCRLARSTRSSHQPTTLSTLARGGHDVLGDVVLMVRRGARRSLASWVLGVRGQCR